MHALVTTINQHKTLAEEEVNFMACMLRVVASAEPARNRCDFSAGGQSARHAVAHSGTRECCRVMCARDDRARTRARLPETVLRLHRASPATRLHPQSRLRTPHRAPRPTATARRRTKFRLRHDEGVNPTRRAALEAATLPATKLQQMLPRRRREVAIGTKRKGLAKLRPLTATHLQGAPRRSRPQTVGAHSPAASPQYALPR